MSETNNSRAIGGDGNPFNTSGVGNAPGQVMNTEAVYEVFETISGDSIFNSNSVINFFSNNKPNNNLWIYDEGNENAIPSSGSLNFDG